MIFSSFAVGYLITHIPGALLSQRFGGKWVLALGVLATTLCNAVTPIGIEYGEFGELFSENQKVICRHKKTIFSGGLTALILLRVLMGFANGSMFPALSVLLSVWVPEKERGKLAAFVMGGGEVRTNYFYSIQEYFMKQTFNFELLFLDCRHSISIYIRRNSASLHMAGDFLFLEFYCVYLVYCICKTKFEFV